MIIIGLVSFYAIYIWIEHRTIHQHVDESQSSLHHTEKQNSDVYLHSIIIRSKSSIYQIITDVTATKRELLKLIRHLSGARKASFPPMR